jgi:hypothetical protein
MKNSNAARQQNYNRLGSDGLSALPLARYLHCFLGGHYRMSLLNETKDAGFVGVGGWLLSAMFQTFFEF